MVKRTFLFLAIILFWGGAAAYAQIEISFRFVHRTVAQAEDIWAFVEVANYTGVPLEFSLRGNASLSFSVEDQFKNYVAGNGQPVVEFPEVIPNGEKRALHVNLLRVYPIYTSLAYTVTPRVHWNGQLFIGPRQSLEILNGLEIFRRVYGRANGDNRIVSLRTLFREGSERLFFRMDSQASGNCLVSMELGRMVRLIEPIVEQDGAGNFHVLHQIAPTRFLHSVIASNGAFLESTYYFATAVRAIRLLHSDGEVIVIGGVPFVEDPNQPAVLTLPGQSEHPAGIEIGDYPVKGKAKKPADNNKKKKK